VANLRLTNSSTFLKTLCTIIAVLLFSVFAGNNSYAQIINDPDNSDIDTTNKKDLIDVAREMFDLKSSKIKRRGKKKVYFSLLPTSSPIPGGGKALITSTSAGFYLGNRRNTNLSSVTFAPYLNFNGRYAISFRSNIFTTQNRWNIQGDTRFSLYPEYVYGSSKMNNANERLLISYKYIRFYQTVLKQIRPYLLAGIGYNLDYHIGIKTVNDTINTLAKFTGYNQGTGPGQNTFSSGLTFNLLYDSRNNSINPLPGAYVNLIYRTNPSILGNGSHPWQSLYLDTRKYISIRGRKRHVLAMWNYIWTAITNNVPYLDLPGIGYEPYQRSGRGMEQNRYRGKGLMYFESEYRSDLTQNGLFGFVVFANINTTTFPANSSLTGFHNAVGAGLRIKFNKRSNTNIAIDYGISKGFSGINFNLGEAF
jgi:outer membrane protein assembly factor BamA